MSKESTDNGSYTNNTPGAWYYPPEDPAPPPPTRENTPEPVIESWVQKISKTTQKRER